MKKKYDIMKSMRKKKGGVAVKLNTLGIAHKIIEEKVCTAK